MRSGLFGLFTVGMMFASGLVILLPTGSSEISICAIENPPEAECNEPCPYPEQPNDPYYLHFNRHPHWHWYTNGTGAWGYYHIHFCYYLAWNSGNSDLQ